MSFVVVVVVAVAVVACTCRLRLPLTLCLEPIVLHVAFATTALPLRTPAMLLTASTRCSASQKRLPEFDEGLAIPVSRIPKTAAVVWISHCWMGTPSRPDDQANSKAKAIYEGLRVRNFSLYSCIGFRFAFCLFFVCLFCLTCFCVSSEGRGGGRA